MEYTTLDKISENLDSKRKPITSSDRVEGEIPYYGASGIVDYVKDYIFDESLLLVSEDGANLLARSTPIAFSVTGKTWINNHAHVLRFSNENLQKFVEIYLNSISLESYVTGSAQPKLNQKMLNGIPIPVVDDSQIEIIVNSVENLKSIIELRKQELACLDELIKARFVEMFGDVQHEEKYKGIQLRELCTTMSGGTPSTKFPEYYEGDIPWISTVSLGPNYIDGTNAKGHITQEAVDNSATKLIPAGNILFGTRVGVGKSSLNSVDICTNQDIVAIVGIDESKFNRLFIKHVLDAYQPYYDSIKKGATILGITGDDLKDTLIPNVPIEIQIEFEKFVHQVDKSKVVYQGYSQYIA